MSNVQQVQYGELDCLQVSLGDAQLLIARQGAQIMSYRRGEEAPLIWLSPEEDGKVGRPIRGGIPICWPWFGMLNRNPTEIQAQFSGAEAPQHGLVRSHDWTLQSVQASAQAVELVFASPEPLTDWPSARARLRIRLSHTLCIALESENPGTQPLFLSEALHSYYQVGDIRQTRVEGLTDCQYLDTLHSWDQYQRQPGDLLFAGETDRIYINPAERLSIVDPVLRRRIILTSRGAGSAVLWNPWIDKAQRLSCFPAEGWQHMLCIETANLLGARLVLAPGQKHALHLSIDRQPFDQE